MLRVAILCSLGSSAPQAAPCPLPSLGALWVLCTGLVPGVQRGRREQGGTSPLCPIPGMLWGNGQHRPGLGLKATAV